MADLGARIRTARKARGLTQKQVAKKMGVTAQNISNFEHKDDLYFSTIQILAAAIGCKLSELVDEPLSELELPAPSIESGIIQIERGADWLGISLISGESILIEKGRIKKITMPDETERAGYRKSVCCDRHAVLWTPLGEAHGEVK